MRKHRVGSPALDPPGTKKCIESAPEQTLGCTWDQGSKCEEDGKSEDEKEGSKDTGSPLVKDLVGGRFWAQPRWVSHFKSESPFNRRLHYALFQDSLLFVGLDSLDKKRTVFTYDLSSIKEEPAVFPMMPVDPTLNAFGAYPGVYIFVDATNGTVTLEFTDDGKETVLPHRFPEAIPITMVSNVSSNGLVYIHDDNWLMLINLRSKESLMVELGNKYNWIFSVSLNKAGTLLAYTIYGGRPMVFYVGCDPDGKITLSECLIEGKFRNNTRVMFLKDNILAIHDIDKHQCTFYSVCETKKSALLLKDNYDAQNLVRLSYCANADVVVAFFEGWKCWEYDFSWMETFFKDTKILILNPKKYHRDFSGISFATSPDLTYIFEKDFCQTDVRIYQISKSSVQH